MTRYSYEWRDAGMFGGRNVARLTRDTEGGDVVVETEGAHGGAAVLTCQRIPREEMASMVRRVLNVAGEDVDEWVRGVRFVFDTPRLQSHMMYIETVNYGGDSQVYTAVSISRSAFVAGIRHIGGIL